MPDLKYNVKGNKTMPNGNYNITPTPNKNIPNELLTADLGPIFKDSVTLRCTGNLLSFFLRLFHYI